MGKENYDKTILEEVNEAIQQTVIPRIDENKKTCSQISEKIDKKADTSWVKELSGKIDGKADVSWVKELSGKIDKKADTSWVKELSGKIDGKADTSWVKDLQNQINSKADKGNTGASSSDLRDVQDKHGLNTCLFVCGVLIFNIIATWFIIYRPSIWSSADLEALPWTYILPLVAVTLVNIAAAIIWIYHYVMANVDYYIWEAFAEIALLIFSVVTMWLFAFYPLGEVTSAVIALAVFLMLANLSALLIRVIYFIYELTSFAPDRDKASLAICIIETILLAVIFIIFVFCIRV